ncbi:substrate-binding domain-containing protein [Agrobacterium larrymoorei]|uniref:Substrate-binding domain-containing protein n=1 Tax=Agrobacterium larrymoorei TaxID=160699 RepID=A0A4D7DTP5_9HYPH|nr:substrate-binding domain-containing protein [Agrobacterium larrymoorei]QCJ00654.1 sugar ABC transporter substrate-binding protein [Agrobacterium larrymoorei]QYA10652.1 substrate-binding domain-containing protein [Agrobacterium larrymoorei]
MRLSVFVTSILLLGMGSVEAKTLGVSIANANDAFLHSLLGGIKTAADKTPDVKLRVEDAGGDPSRQMEQIGKLASDRVDAMIVILSDGDLGAKISQIGTTANIPVVYVNNVPVNFAELPAHQTVVASDEVESGTMETQEVCRLLGGKGRAVVLIGEYFHPAARTRTMDIDSVLSTDACKGIAILERQSANWSRDQADDLMQEWLTAGVKFDAVIANNDEMALGAIRAMKRNNMQMDKVVVSGIDATSDALDAMAAGDLDVSVLQNAPQQGSKGVEAAIKLMNGDTVPTFIKVPFELVTPVNLKSYQVKSQ